MNYCVLLAGGSGTRMKNINIPKQYYEINGVPIIIYTLKRLIESNCFDYFYLAVSDNYKEFMNSLLTKYFNKEVINKITIVSGGKERIDSIHNVMKAIDENQINEDDVIVIHDAVRPFVTNRIIIDSIEGARKYGATVAAVASNDTVLVSDNGEYVDSIPIRKTIFYGQAPDSFNLKKFIELENNLTEEQKKIITGTSQICTLNNFPIKMIKGDSINFKITTDSDLKIAKQFILRK